VSGYIAVSNFLVVDNTLDRQFDLQTSDVSWGIYIAYTTTLEGFGYLAALIDLYSRRVIGWWTCPGKVEGLSDSVLRNRRTRWANESDAYLWKISGDQCLPFHAAYSSTFWSAP
jgi:transposase InsO family protein